MCVVGFGMIYKTGDLVSGVMWRKAVSSMLKLMEGRKSSFFLTGAIRRFFVLVGALVKGVREGEARLLVMNQDREDVINHLTQTPKAERETQKPTIKHLHP